MENLLRDFRHGVRMLRRTPGFTAVAIAVLALGIGVNTAVFSLVNTLILQPRPGRIDRLHAVFTRDRTQQERGYRDFSYPAYLDLKARTDIFDSLMAHTFSTVGITEGGAGGEGVTKQTFAAIVSSNYFSTLGVTMAVGRGFTPDEERPGANARVAVASYAAWRRTGFDPSFVGRTIRASGADYTVIGVTPRGFAGTMTLVSPEWWFPLGCYDTIVNEMFKTRTTGLTDRGNYPLNLAALLHDGVSQTSAEAALDTLGRQLSDAYPGTDKNQIFTLGPLPRMSVSSQPQTTDPLYAVTALLMLMAGLVLVVACLNLANMLLARGAARRKEIAIRQALGSSRSRIVRQLLVEGLTLSIAGAAFGVVLGWWTTSALTAWFSSVMPLGLELVAEPSSRLIVAAAGFAVFSTVCFAMGPSWSLSRPTVSGDLKGDHAATSATGRARRRFGTGSMLVVGQLAVSLALVAAGGLFVRGGINASRADAGFVVDRHVLISLDASLAGYDAARISRVYRDALARVRAVPGIEHASLGAIVPFGEFQEGRTVRLKPGDKGFHADFNIVGAEYFTTLGVPVLRGREFTAAEEEAGSTAASAIVDRTLSGRLFGSDEPLGQQILIQGREGEAPRTFTVVGVVGETKHDLFDREGLTHVYVSSGSLFRSMMTIHARTAPGVSETAILGTIRRELRALDSSLPILSTRTMAEHRYRSITEWSVRAAATMFATLGGLALLLATIGVVRFTGVPTSRGGRVNSASASRSVRPPATWRGW